MKKNLLIAALALLGGFASAQVSDTIVSLTPSNKNVVLEEYTGVNCTYCPDGHKRANELAAANPGRVFLINIHTGGYAANYQTEFGTALMNQTGLQGFPSGTINRHVFSGSTTALDRSQWASKAAVIMGQSSPVNIAAEGTIDFQTRELNLKVQLYYTADQTVTSNALNVAILQNNVLGPQVGGSNFNPSQMVGSQYNHMHMLRHLITGQWGETITNTTAGTLVEKNYTYTIPQQFGITNQLVNAILEDLTIVAFVAEGHQEILTGCEANIAYVNVPAIYPRVDGMTAEATATCADEATASLSIKNAGSEPISSLAIEYTVGNGSAQTYNWTGNIACGATQDVQLPTFNITPNANVTVSANILSVNGETYTSTASTATVSKNLYSCGGWMMFELITDRYASETRFKIYDPNGSVVLQGGPFTDLSANGTTVHQYDFTPSTVGCYKLEVTDSYGDGMNAGYGAGGFKLYRADNSLVFSNNGKIGSGVFYMLDVTEPTDIEEHVANSINVYPNPATSTLNIVSEEPVLRAELYNLQGQVVASQSGNVNTMSVSNIANGIYMLRLTTAQGTTSQKIVKQ